MKDKDINSLDYTTRRCQYRVVFAPKYRRMVVYGEIKADIGKNLAATVSAERSGDYRSRGVCRPHPYAHQQPAEVQCITDHGIPKGEKQSHDLRPTCQS